jgi:hypothetical protein
VAAIGGIPYWLGAPFRGTWPDAHPEGDLAVVGYTVRDRGRPVTVTITTGYAPKIPSSAVSGHVVLRAHPEDTTAIVTATRPVSPALRRAVRRHLRPFLHSDPDAKQLPGDVQAAPTRIDHSQPRRSLWFGLEIAGLRATVVASPAGVGVIRYGAPSTPGRFYVVTYRPLPKKCGSVGCASPPPLPEELRRYGRETHASWILGDGWVTTILAPHPHRATEAVSQVTAVATPTPAIG